MSKQDVPRIEIHKSRAKQPYSVHYFSKFRKKEGRELLARSENLTSMANCRKNIRSMGRIFVDRTLFEISVEVNDFSLGKDKPRTIHVSI